MICAESQARRSARSSRVEFAALRSSLRPVFQRKSLSAPLWKVPTWATSTPTTTAATAKIRRLTRSPSLPAETNLPSKNRAAASRGLDGAGGVLGDALALLPDLPGGRADQHGRRRP